jgi:hypothetical protein
MLRYASLTACAGLAAACALPAAAESYTTRIEPRQFYGATVTLEEGVRVFRPLPATRQVIINPNGTPLALSFQDVRVTEEVNNYLPAPSGDLSEGSVYEPGFFAPGFFGGRFHHRHERLQGGRPVFPRHQGGRPAFPRH